VVGHPRPEAAHLGLGGIDVSESVEHHVRARAREALRHAEPDAAGRARDQGGFSFEHPDLLTLDTMDYSLGA
jgi:hypothetical protein